MPFKRSRILLGVAAAALLGLAACGGGGSGEAPEGQMRRGIGAEPMSVDPHKVQGTWESDVVGDMFLGLFTDDMDATPIPGVAESWTVSEDGLVWTFKLRQTVWSDGEPVTADDFVFAFQRLLNPETTGAVYASVQYGIKNAQEVNGGRMPLDALGVRAIDDYTLEMTLAYPQPYLPSLLKHSTGMPVPRHAIEAHGDSWTRPENIVVNGAYKLAEWRTGDFLRTVANERFEGSDQFCFKEVVYFTVNDHDAMVRRAMAGDIDMNNSFPTGQRAETESRLPGWPRVSPRLTTTYTAPNMSRAPFSDVRVRRALSMAVDREFLTESILGAGQIPAYGFLPPDMDNYSQNARSAWADMPRDQRLEEARRLLTEAGFGPNNPLTFEYIHRSTGDNPRIAPVMQANWADIADWVRPQIRQVDTQALYKQLQQADFETSDAGWQADFNDPYNFLYLLDSRTGAMNYGRYVNPAYDALLDQSNMELDLDKRAEILRQAEQMILDDAAVIPVLHTVTQNLVNPRITGFEDNPQDIHRTRFMCRQEAG